jgi:hypothetical protein
VVFKIVFAATSDGSVDRAAAGPPACWGGIAITAAIPTPASKYTSLRIVTSVRECGAIINLQKALPSKPLSSNQQQFKRWRMRNFTARKQERARGDEHPGVV